jgi:hypothetical protein
MKTLYPEILNAMTSPGVVIAFNDSHYSWEYDCENRTAILKARTDGELFLSIVSLKTKSGLGAGHWVTEVRKVRAGTLRKPFLGLIRQTLKETGFERSRCAYPFKPQWIEANQGGEEKLGAIVKWYAGHRDKLDELNENNIKMGVKE